MRVSSGANAPGGFCYDYAALASARFLPVSARRGHTSCCDALHPCLPSSPTVEVRRRSRHEADATPIELSKPYQKIRDLSGLCRPFTKSAQSTASENIGPERVVPALLAAGAVLSPSRITLEYKEKIRPQPDRENAFARASGGAGGIRTHGTLSRTVVFKTTALNPSATAPEPSCYWRGLRLASGRRREGRPVTPDRAAARPMPDVPRSPWRTGRRTGGPRGFPSVVCAVRDLFAPRHGLGPRRAGPSPRDNP